MVSRARCAPWPRPAAPTRWRSPSPCHRVVGKDGGLGGYSMGGTHIKVHLLELESGKREQFAAA
ncbi:MAG: MGMT family protein [Alphaproteobacteria bacterium]